MDVIKNSLAILLPAMRISIALAFLTTSIIFSADMLGFTANEDQLLLDARTKISESLAIQFSVFEPEKDIKKIQKLVRYIVKRNPDILSAGLRLKSGDLIIKSSNHEQLWGDYKEKNSNSTHVFVPILLKGSPWGNVEIRYKDLDGLTLSGFFSKSIFTTGIYVLLVGFFAYLVFVLRTLKQLDPSAVIPGRVNAAFDTLSEGVFIVDENEQILLTNRAFSEKIGLSAESLVGKKASQLEWKQLSAQDSATEYPWNEVLKSGKTSVGVQLQLKSEANEVYKFVLNASPIAGDDDNSRGVLVTLDDITELEQRNTDMEVVIERLEETKSKIEQQNEKLHYLATRDSMTGCLNRRSYGDQFEVLFNAARKNGAELCCIMVDLDHFKLVNDNYGHAVGDVVIKLLAEILQASSREGDLIGRYGGEEFCMVLPHQTIETAIGVAERVRLRMKDESTNRFKDGPHVTASIGVASIFDNPQNPDELNNLADEALYVAKTSGRNQVVRWSPGSEMNPADEAEAEKEQEVSQQAEDKLEISRLKKRILDLDQMASQFSKEIEYTKNFDALTGLPNQLLFNDRLKEAIAHGNRNNQLVAVLVIDINMFSQINASFGRAVGDLVLKEFANRLNSNIRKSEGISGLAASRFSADEFAIVLTELNQVEQVTWAVKRLLERLNASAEIEDHTIYLNSQVGISLYPNDADNVDDLFNNAIAAKQHCKTKDTEYNYQFFDKKVQGHSVNQVNLEREIRTAIEQEQWQLMYQPKLDIKTKKITGLEALIRWNHPERGLLSPYEFIDFAEKRGLIISIGDWVIKQACLQLRNLLDLGIRDCHIAINLSGAQLMQPDVVDKIFSALDAMQIPPRLFEIEVTETMLMNNIQVAAESLLRLHARGIRIAIDDFGTGYSSLAYLKKLPIDSIKIDRAFIKDICDDDNDKKIVQAIISMAQSMDMSVTAEGVEEWNQHDLLNDYGCDEVQGYLFAKPLPEEQLEQILFNPETLLKNSPRPLKTNISVA